MRSRPPNRRERYRTRRSRHSYVMFWWQSSEKSFPTHETAKVKHAPGRFPLGADVGPDHGVALGNGEGTIEAARASPASLNSPKRASRLPSQRLAQRILQLPATPGPRGFLPGVASSISRNANRWRRAQRKIWFSTVGRRARPASLGRHRMAEQRARSDPSGNQGWARPRASHGMGPHRLESEVFWAGPEKAIVTCCAAAGWHIVGRAPPTSQFPRFWEATEPDSSGDRRCSN